MLHTIMLQTTEIVVDLQCDCTKNAGLAVLARAPMVIAFLQHHWQLKSISHRYKLLQSKEKSQHLYLRCTARRDAGGTDKLRIISRAAPRSLTTADLLSCALRQRCSMFIILINMRSLCSQGQGLLPIALLCITEYVRVRTDGWELWQGNKTEPIFCATIHHLCLTQSMGNSNFRLLAFYKWQMYPSSQPIHSLFNHVTHVCGCKTTCPSPAFSIRSTPATKDVSRHPRLCTRRLYKCTVVTQDTRG